MGFVTGFLGGITLTSSILYLTVSLHTRNRLQQSALLAQQSQILLSIIEPPPLPPPTSAREARVSVVESAKDRWNSEIESLVKRLQGTDWGLVRERAERRVEEVWRASGAGNVLRDAEGRVGAAVEDGKGKVGELILDGKEAVKSAIQEGKEAVPNSRREG